MENVYNMSDYRDENDKQVNEVMLGALTQGILEEKTMDVLMNMFESGLVDISMDDEGEMFFEVNADATEEEWEAARENFLQGEGII